MKKILVTALLATSLLLAMPAAMSAAPWHAGAATGGKARHAASLSVRPARALQQQTAGRVSFVPLADVLSGTAELNGHVYTAQTVQPLSGATVGWWVDSAEGTGRGTTTTGVHGAYTLSNVAPATGNGLVWVERPAVGEASWYELDFTDRTWVDGSVSTYDFEPSQVYMYSSYGGPWFDYRQQPWLIMRGTDLAGGLESYTDDPVDSADEPPGMSYLSGPALPGTYTSFCLNFWSNEGVELTGDVTVPSGWLAQTDLTFEQASAQRLWEVTNYTASGDPGTVVRLRLQNFPAGEVTDFYGYQYEPVMTPYRSFGSFTAQDLANQYKRVTIPSTAKVGQDYVIGGQHRDGLLDLEVYFQVTRLKGPSSSSGSYRLTGQVPIASYDGSKGDTGGRKYVYLYRRFTSAAQPKGDPTKHGWKFMRRYRTDNTGKFTTYSMNPGRTAWYVVYYPEDTDNWSGFTSVRRVRHS
jgi:hypothetical protein